MSDRIQVYDIAPVAYVRQTRADRWKKRPVVLRYRAFRDEVAARRIEIPDDFFHVVFLLPMPASWSEKKKRETCGWPHQGKPDADNLTKGLLDAVYRNADDAHVWNYSTTKLWSYHGAIVIADDFLPFFELPVDLGDLVRSSWEVYDRPRDRVRRRGRDDPGQPAE